MGRAMLVRSTNFRVHRISCRVVPCLFNRAVLRPFNKNLDLARPICASCRDFFFEFNVSKSQNHLRFAHINMLCLVLQNSGTVRADPSPSSPTLG